MYSYFVWTNADTYLLIFQWLVISCGCSRTFFFQMTKDGEITLIWPDKDNLFRRILNPLEMWKDLKKFLFDFVKMGLAAIKFYMYL